MKEEQGLGAQVVRSMALAMAVGLDLACVLLVCVLIGHYLDGRLQSSPWGLLIGILAGLVGGAYSVYRMVMRVFR